jgi:AcrR family transcriptional regulator
MPDGTRQRLIDCAVTLLASEGIDAVTLRRVAREAGISHGAPLRHFPSLAALLSAVAATGFADLHARVAALTGDPRSRLVAACRCHLDFAREAPALYELMFRRDLLSLSQAVFVQFAELVADVQAPRPHATSLWAAVYGLAHLCRADALDVTLAAYLR